MIVWLHQHSLGASKRGKDQIIGRSRGALTTKIHDIFYALGNPVELDITQGRDADIIKAGPLLKKN